MSWPSNPGLCGSQASPSEIQDFSLEAAPVGGPCRRRRVWRGGGMAQGGPWALPLPLTCLCGPGAFSAHPGWEKTARPQMPWSPALQLTTMYLQGTLSEPPFPPWEARMRDHKPSSPLLSSPPSSVLARPVTSLGLSFSRSPALNSVLGKPLPCWTPSRCKAGQLLGD